VDYRGSAAERRLKWSGGAGRASTERNLSRLRRTGQGERQGLAKDAARLESVSERAATLASHHTLMT